ncbi:hypothetical protein BCU70_00805 [Vibrio sp. 10N.286.49.C2]|uniref:MerR family transcriptional regulator n=1 Tax=unclassified Vibrio TaxID=2614977 RepID=UPI000CB0C016|nr:MULTISPECIES: MerR family transcriptional regulator [unclassified Vibrio]PMH42738.1 hypothetical protein BCU70_00805 [Vibrio sp. 10N.286.49.C2]PMH53924.1 hypothetical protein BCU66_14030 [Vibrio sp. 10N.286.49.B1]PMH79641.1 hypothetical protein BCU58_04755 [Vibrio sp. 10N.286.48.B7]
MASKETCYAIREVADITGIKPVTLRAWQRRYNLIQPERTDKGHRLYTQSDIEKIKCVQGWLAKGVSIGKVKSLIDSNTLLTEQTTSVQLDEVEHVLEALSLLDGSKTDRIISYVLKEYPLAVVETQFVLPVLSAIDFVKAGLRSLQLALFRTTLINRLMLMIQAESKKSLASKCLLINMDSVGNVFAWFYYANLVEQGIAVTFLDGVDEIAALFNDEIMMNFQHVHVFAEKSLSEKHLAVIREQREYRDTQIHVSPVIDLLI